MPQINASLSNGRNIVLQAPPGSGKTTRVPPAVLSAPWLADKKIIMLEPRRLAARSAAFYISRCFNEPCGGTVGYHVRTERRLSERTRIEIMTEGLLINRLLADPELNDIGLVIFDEFHERSLSADTALAMTLEMQQALRPDLRIIVMSATLQPDVIAAHIGQADIHTAHAVLYPVRTVLLQRASQRPVYKQAADAARNALINEEGSILIFLPGEREIRACCDELLAGGVPDNVTVYPLFASLSAAEQDQAIAQAMPGQRKIVVATSVAESSLTIEGVRVVIDSGLMRVPRFSPRLGMPRLETLRVTRDRADQRRGRAGRIEPGVCFRLWDVATDRMLKEESLPEILEADLAATALQCAQWGAVEVDDLPWLTPPPSANWQSAVKLLCELDAMRKTAGRFELTERGSAMARIPVHPRLAHMIVAAAQQHGAYHAALTAACVSERSASARLRRIIDVTALLRVLRDEAQSVTARLIRRLAKQWTNDFNGTQDHLIDEGTLLAWAFPDRIARRRNQRGVYLLRSGQGAIIDTAEPLANEEWLVAAELHEEGANARIRLAAALTQQQVCEIFSDYIQVTDIVEWNRQSETVLALSRVALGAIAISDAPCAQPNQLSVSAALMEGVRIKGVEQLSWSQNAQTLCQRVTLLAHLFPDQGWPLMTNETLTETLSEWLAPATIGIRSWSQLQKIDLYRILSDYLQIKGCNLRMLEQLAPTHVAVPSGSKIKICYDAEQPYLRVRLQEVFGLKNTPAIAAGRVPLVLHLLSPAHRPVQVTQDLESFWNSSYALVRKDMRGRYPKHYWPENPLQAEPR